MLQKQNNEPQIEEVLQPAQQQAGQIMRLRTELDQLKIDIYLISEQNNRLMYEFRYYDEYNTKRRNQIMSQQVEPLFQQWDELLKKFSAKIRQIKIHEEQIQQQMNQMAGENQPAANQQIQPEKNQLLAEEQQQQQHLHWSL